MLLRRLYKMNSKMNGMPFVRPYPMIIDHIDYIVKLIGINHVGIGSDFDGVGNATPQQLDDVTGYPLLTKALLDRGYSRKDILKILGGNFLRLLKANENISGN